MNTFKIFLSHIEAKANQYYWMPLLKNYQKNRQIDLMIKWILMFCLNRFTLIHNLAIFFLTRAAGKIDKKAGESESSLFENVKVDEIVEMLKKDGFCTPLHLPNYILQHIRHFAAVSSITGHNTSEFCFLYKEKERVFALSKKPLIAAYYLSPLTEPALEKITTDPKIIEIATKFLGRKPIFRECRLWWNFSTECSTEENAKIGQVFHYDLHDYHALNFFFYLTDVDLENGPHVCIRGSHKKKKLAHQFSFRRRRSDKEMIDYYSAENIVTICGEAGLGIVEDPLCFHKGSIPSHKDRLMLQIGFAINSY